MNAPILAGLREQGIDVRFYASPEALLRAGDDLGGAQILITNSCPRELIARAPRLSAIINPYTGSERIDRLAAQERSIIIGNGGTPENYVGMAEATILLLLHCFYELPQCMDVLRHNRPRPDITARMLAGKTVGVIGYGRIAQSVISRLVPWQLALLVSAPRLHAPLVSGVSHVELEDLLRRSDAVLVLCSLNAGTRNLLNRERLSLMRRGAVLINTSRGGIVDEAAVAEMARDGHLSKIALDAFEVEPLPTDSPLRELSNAVLTPHMIGHTVEAETSMWRTACESVRRVLAGQPPVYVFNPEVLDTWLARQAGAASR